MGVELFEISSSNRAQVLRQCGRGPTSPGTNDEDHRHQSEPKRHKGNNPGGAIEPSVCGSSQDRGAILLYERLRDQAVAIAPRYGSHPFVAHDVGIRAADGIALQQNFTKTSDAHQLVAEAVKARHFLSAEHQKKDD